MFQSHSLLGGKAPAPQSFGLDSAVSSSEQNTQHKTKTQTTRCISLSFRSKNKNNDLLPPRPRDTDCVAHETLHGWLIIIINHTRAQPTAAQHSPNHPAAARPRDDGTHQALRTGSVGANASLPGPDSHSHTAPDLERPCTQQAAGIPAAGPSRRNGGAHSRSDCMTSDMPAVCGSWVLGVGCF